MLSNEPPEKGSLEQRSGSFANTMFNLTCGTLMGLMLVILVAMIVVVMIGAIFFNDT